MIKEMIVVGALMTAFALSVCSDKTWAQDSATTPKTSTPEAPKPVEAYRLDFSINELEEGKKINARLYSMDLTKSQPQSIKIGTKIPVNTKEGEFQYLDVGTNIMGRLQTHNDQLELVVDAEMSNIATPEPAQGHDSHPLIRQFKIGGSTLVQLGKPMLIGSADDPNSKRQFQVEVTMTKLR